MYDVIFKRKVKTKTIERLLLPHKISHMIISSDQKKVKVKV